MNEVNETINSFYTSIYKEGYKWWLSISSNAEMVTLDHFKTKRAAADRLEDVRAVLGHATHDEARRMFGVCDNRPHNFIPGSVNNLDYARA